MRRCGLLAAPEVIGIWLIVGATVAFVLTYGVVVKWPKFLLGELTRLWFRCLTWIVAGGLFLLALEALSRMFFTVLFWRR